MRRWILFLLLSTVPAEAAILRGYAVEHSTGKVLSRVLVAIQPLPGTSGPTLSVRSNSYGIFEFINIPSGAYLVNASRRGFAPVHYGQKRWNAAGTPVVLEQEQTVTISIRLPRYGAITGYVVDENDVGMSEHEVLAYRNTRPPKPIAKFPTDDRGWFRIWGLEPGTYLVRTAPKRYEDADYLPTFFRETLRVEEGSTVQVALDQDTSDVRVRPLPGRLVSIVGGVSHCYPPRPVTVTLVSDMGRETITSDGSFQFPNKPPGNYEIFAEVPPDGRRPNSACGGYQYFPLENRDRTVGVPLLPLPLLTVFLEGVPGLDAGAVRILARRKDLAGEAEPQVLRLTNNAAQLNPGRWELQIASSPNYVAIGFSGPRGERPSNDRADGWNEILLTGNSPVRFVLSSKPGAIHGLVTGGAHDPVPGAPVLLEAYDPQTRKRLLDLRIVRADMQGRYQITGLAPGTYRIVSTFDYDSPDVDELDTLYPRTIKVEEGRDQQLDLDLSVIR
jgi:hypothetical protein